MDNVSSLEKQVFWDRFLKAVEDRVNVHSFTTWFKPLTLVDISGDTLVIGVPETFYASWLEEHYIDLINTSLAQLVDTPLTVSFVVNESIEEVIPHIEEAPPAPVTVQANVSDQNSPIFEQQVINSRFNFDSFVVGNSNQFAYAAAQAVAEAPGNTAFNPLVIYGGVGLGKTHLIQAISHHYMSSGKPSDRKRLIYVSSEKFTMDFIMSIQNNLTSKYSTYYRSSDLLLVDDIQFFNNKERTQEEFFHIFNALHQSGKQIVLTMDRPPSQLKGLADRLINRFQWGLVTDIQPPDFETRVAIIYKKAEADGVQLDGIIAEYIAENITSNIRELEGSMIRLLAYSSLHGLDISLELAEKVLGETFSKKSKIITIESIQKIVSSHFALSYNLIMGNSRRKEVAVARHIAMYLSKKFTDSSLKTIGLHFSGRDHSTVIHSIRTVENKYLKDPALSNHIQSLVEQVKHS